jgi:hypothetical protein
MKNQSQAGTKGATNKPQNQPQRAFKPSSNGVPRAGLLASTNPTDADAEIVLSLRREEDDTELEQIPLGQQLSAAVRRASALYGFPVENLIRVALETRLGAPSRAAQPAATEPCTIIIQGQLGKEIGRRSFSETAMAALAVGAQSEHLPLPDYVAMSAVAAANRVKAERERKELEAWREMRHRKLHRPIYLDLPYGEFEFEDRVLIRFLSEVIREHAVALGTLIPDAATYIALAETQLTGSQLPGLSGVVTVADSEVLFHLSFILHHNMEAIVTNILDRMAPSESKVRLAEALMAAEAERDRGEGVEEVERCNETGQITQASKRAADVWEEYVKHATKPAEAA